MIITQGERVDLQAADHHRAGQLCLRVQQESVRIYVDIVPKTVGI